MKRQKKILGMIVSALMVLTMIPLQSLGAQLPFSDVPENEWYYSDVKEAYETRLIDGFEDNTFRPNENMTYAQAVKLAACMNQKYTIGSVTLKNGTRNWWDSYVDYAKKNHIISKDYEWNIFATRAGYVEIFANALPDEALKEKNTIPDGYIPDVGITHPQAAAIYKLYRAGVLTGMDILGTFEPNNNIRRSEVSAILTRMMNENARKDLVIGKETKKVIFNSTGGSAVETQHVVQYEKAVKPANPTREGYRFAGWYSDDELTTAFDFECLISEDQILYAKWEKTTNDDVVKRQDGERFEGVITIEGMEEIVKYEHVRDEIVGFEMDYDYEKFERKIELDKERFVSRYDDPKNPENYLEVTSSSQDAETVAASVSEDLSRDYDIIKQSFVLDRAGNCLRIGASSLKGNKGTPDQLQMVYIIPAADGSRIATAHYSYESADGFGRRFADFMNSFTVLSGRGERRITNEQALNAIEKYSYTQMPELEDIVKEGKQIVSWGVISTDNSEIVVLFRSYTGSEKRYYIDPASGNTYVTESVPGVSPGENRTDESLNVWDYIS